MSLNCERHTALSARSVEHPGLSVLSVHVDDVVALSSDTQVVGVDARRVVAGVHHHSSGRNLADPGLIGNTVTADGDPVNVESGVMVSGFRCAGHPASFGGHIPSGPLESLKGGKARRCFHLRSGVSSTLPPSVVVPITPTPRDAGFFASLDRASRGKLGRLAQGVTVVMKSPIVETTKALAPMFSFTAFDRTSRSTSRLTQRVAVLQLSPVMELAEPRRVEGLEAVNDRATGHDTRIAEGCGYHRTQL